MNELKVTRKYTYMQHSYLIARCARLSKLSAGRKFTSLIIGLFEDRSFEGLTLGAK